MGTVTSVSASFTRPNDANDYAAGDLVANSTTAGSVVPMSFKIPVGPGRSIRITEWHLHKSDADVANADFDLYLWTASPTSTAGDNAAFVASSVVAANEADDFLGVLAGGLMLGFTTGAAQVYSMNQANTPTHTIGSDELIYGLLVAQAAYVPAANEVFTVILEVEHIGS